MKYFSSLAALVLGSTLACGDLIEGPCQSAKCSVIERCTSDGDCLEQEICESGYCTDPSAEASPVGEPIRINGATVQEGRASSEGSVPFADITVVLQDEQGGMIYNPTAASVLYWRDNADHRCFVVNHPDYTPTVDCPRLYAASNKDGNSGSHPLARLTLTSAPLQLLWYDEREDPTARLRDEESAEAFFYWGRNTGRYVGCREKDQLLTMLDGGSFIVKLPFLMAATAGDFVNGGLKKILIDEATTNVIGYFSERLTREWREDTVADAYLFLPSEHGFGPSTGSLWTIEPRLRRDGEECGTVPEPTGTPEEASCDLPACIQMGRTADCLSPCVRVPYGNRCLLPCEDDADCGFFGEILLRCRPLSAFGGEEGQACLLSECSSDTACAPGEACINLTDYGYVETPSGADVSALARHSEVCYPVECLEE